MPRTPLAAIHAFRRRIAAVALLHGAGQGLAMVGGLGAATLVALHVCGVPCPPNWWWAGGAAPVLGLALWRERRERRSVPEAAAHLDRRLGLDGLLLSACATEDLDPAWRVRVDAALRGLPAALPHPRWRRLLPAPLLAAALATGAALLPPPKAPEAPRALPTYKIELARIQAGMQDLFDRGHLPEEVVHELQQRMGELQQAVDAGEAPEWRDLDELDQRVTREQMLQLAQEAAGRRGSPPGKADVAKAAGTLAQAAKMLSDLGLLDKLPQHLGATLQALRAADGTFDFSQLQIDPAQVQALADQFADLAKLLPELGAIDPGQLADLEEILKKLGNGGFGNPGGNGQQPGAGGGGVDEGPGHAALDFTESAEGQAPAALPIAAGRGLPGEWVPVGDKRIDPVIAPVRDTGSGTAAPTAAGGGGASWQLDYAPRHREVLRRFFDQTAERKDGK